MGNEARSLGWLGTGRMGAALASRLIDAGYQVTVWNRTPARPGRWWRGARASGCGTRISCRSTISRPAAPG